jgi:hypothetical protein
MKQLCIALFVALLPCVAEAKYRLPPAHEIYGQSTIIVVGEVQSHDNGFYVVKVTQQLLGPKAPLTGEIRVARRGRHTRCAPQDPVGVEAGTSWVWVLEPQAETGRYRSWISAPFRLEKNRVRTPFLQPKGVRQGPTVEEFKALVEGYRRCFKTVGRKVTQIATADEVKAYAATSPHAAALVQATPR